LSKKAGALCISLIKKVIVTRFANARPAKKEVKKLLLEHKTTTTEVST
jgi:hypothetical protein